MRKKSGAITTMTRVILVSIVFSMTVAPFAFSTASVKGCGKVVTSSGMKDCCCSSESCCSMKKSGKTESPQPMGTARASSAQQLLNALPVSSFALLYELPFTEAKVRFSHEDFSLPSFTPLAQSCIQLI